MRAGIRFVPLLLLAAAVAQPAGADEGTGADGDVAATSPFAGTPLSVSELAGTNAAGLAAETSSGGRKGANAFAVILWDEALPPRTQTPAPRPGKRTEIRQGGRLLFTTVSAPR